MKIGIGYISLENVRLGITLRQIPVAESPGFYVYEYVCVCVCVYIHIHIYRPTHMCVSMNVCMYVRTYVCTYVSVVPLLLSCYARAHQMAGY